jgi:hypothetical protein
VVSLVDFQVREVRLKLRYHLGSVLGEGGAEPRVKIGNIALVAFEIAVKLAMEVGRLEPWSSRLGTGGRVRNRPLVIGRWPKCTQDSLEDEPTHRVSVHDLPSHVFQRYVHSVLGESDHVLEKALFQRGEKSGVW